MCAIGQSRWRRVFSSRSTSRRSGRLLFLPSGSCQEKTNFFRGHQTVLARFEAGKIQVAESDTGQLQDEVVQCVEKSSDFTVSSFGKRDPIPGICFGKALLFQFQWKNRTTIQAYLSGSEPVQVFRSDNALDLYKVGPGNLVAGMEDPLRQIPVVGQKKNAFRLDVQTTDMDQRVYLWEKFLEGRFSIGIMKG